MGKKKVNNPSLPSTEKESLNSEQQNIVEWLKKVRFRKQLFGGISEQDVWKKIDELNNETLITETKAGDSLLKERAGDE